VLRQPISDTFKRFVDAERSGSILLLLATAFSLAAANLPIGAPYLDWWESSAGSNVRHWINDGLMAVFFLLIGLELEREFYAGELSDRRTALLPVLLAAGGMIAPALIHLALNANATTQAGFGIPVATDIAFALGILALLGNRIPPALKVLVVAYAAIDDLGAVALIAIFYTSKLSLGYLAAALGAWIFLCALNRFMRVMSIASYLAGGALMWFLMLKSGVHATVAGVLLAFSIPFASRQPGIASPSHRVESVLQKPVALVVLPLFALANTAIPVDGELVRELSGPNSLGIVIGLVVGKPAGILLLCWLALASGLCRLPSGVGWRHVAGAGLLGGIGFTMSIFVATLAFAGDPGLVNSSKMAVLLASLVAGAAGYAWLRARIGK
jgi:Na+:H+ antiporter, NhaA family